MAIIQLCSKHLLGLFFIFVVELKLLMICTKKKTVSKKRTHFCVVDDRLHAFLAGRLVT